MQYPQIADLVSDIAEVLSDIDLSHVGGTTPYVLAEIPGTNQGRSQALPFICALCLSLQRLFLQFISCMTFQGTNIF